MHSKQRIYAQLLKLYPKQYRQKYADQMVQTLSDMLDDQPTSLAALQIWLRALAELPVSIISENIMAGGNLMQEMPTYVKRSSVIGALCVLPFWIIVVSGVLRHVTLHARYETVALVLTLMLLNACAFALCTASYIKWFSDNAVQKKRSVISRLLDLQHTWPMLIVGAIGLFVLIMIPFHDSAHCVTGNPMREIHNPRQTWQCVDNGFMGGK